MIVIMKVGTPMKEILRIKDRIEKENCRASIIEGENCTILGLVGDTTKVDPNKLLASEYVERVTKVQQPYKLSNRIFHPDNTVVKIGKEEIGGNNIALIAGPCSVESEEQIIEIAKSVKKSGARFLRGGAFKPRTSPYSFQGMGLDGLELLKLARKETGLPIVTEIMSTNMIDKFVEDVDVIQVGARNMQNFDLLKELGKTKKPILLKRGISATIEELIMSAEYIMSEGNNNVILCERGIRTYENLTRNTLDLSAIPMLKKLTHLPVIVDPSHSSGLWWMVEPLSKAAIAAGADGLIIEVHNDPENAKCDGQQSITPERFESLKLKLEKLAAIEERGI